MMMMKKLDEATINRFKRDLNIASYGNGHLHKNTDL